jgi:hypothetical protein
VTFKQQLKAHAPGLTVRQALDKLQAMQMLDVHFPTTDGRELIFTRYTEPERSAAIARQARLGAAAASSAENHRCKSGRANVVQTFDPSTLQNQAVALARHAELRKSG